MQEMCTVCQHMKMDDRTKEKSNFSDGHFEVRGCRVTFVHKSPDEVTSSAHIQQTPRHSPNALGLYDFLLTRIIGSIRRYD